MLSTTTTLPSYEQPLVSNAKTTSLPLIQFQQQIHIHQMKEHIQKLEKREVDEQKKTLQIVESLQQILPVMHRQHQSELLNLYALNQQREQDYLLAQGLEQRRHQEEMNNLQEKFSRVNLQLQCLLLEKQIESTQHLSNRIMEQHRYPKKKEIKYDEKVSDTEDARHVCVICLENRRLCVVQPCKHLSLCVACSSIELEDCPECRTKITCIERLYF